MASTAQGFAYVGYKTQEAAAAALDQFNCIDFPPSSGQRLKVRLQPPKLVCNYLVDNVQLRAAASPGAFGPYK